MLQYIRNRKVSSRTNTAAIDTSLPRDDTSGGSFRSTISTSLDSLVYLVIHEDWKLALHALTCHPTESYSEYSDYRMSNGDTLVHFVCRNHPNYDIIEKLIQIIPDSLSTINADGQLPIHVAVHHGAHPIIIDYMIQCSANSLKKRDSLGRAPLHIACAFYSESFKNTIGMCEYSKFSAASKVIKILARKGASVVNAEDNNGFSALEYAIISNSDLEAIHFLQHCCQRNWKGAYVKRKLQSTKEMNFQNM